MTPHPEISVVIPTYQRADRLAACLDALGRSEGARFEVVVVDDGSAEPMAPVVEAAAATGVPARCIRQDNAGPAAARNRGADAARAPVLAFTDDDCRPAPGWLTVLLAASRRDPNALLGGRTINGEADNPYSQSSQDLVSFMLEARRDEFGFFTTNNMACTKERFGAVGGFDEAFPLAAGEDREFGLRWTAEGGTLLHVPGAVVAHHHTLGLRTFWRQHANYGRGARTLSEARGPNGPGKPGPRALSFYRDAVTYPLRTGGSNRLRRAGLIALSQAATAYGFYAGRRGGA